ncbi:hypothetical protein BSKO_02362 [Bryopsis sp. KO-2023]|nr:hypothetical protein BSKO_02362 [Bryopsis sp. KO-2023]
MTRTNSPPPSNAAQYQPLERITHKGHVISFAQRPDGRVFYSVSRKQSNEEAATYPAHPPKELLFPNEVFSSSSVGRVDVVTIPPSAISLESVGKSDAGGDSFWSTTAHLGAIGTFVAVADESEVYVFRQTADDNGSPLYRTTSGGSSTSAKSNLVLDTEGKRVPVVTANSILVDRFTLINKDLVGKQYLTKAMEFAREPTAELSFIRNVAKGEVTVKWVDTGRIKRWRIETHNSATGLSEAVDVQRDVGGAYTETGSSEKATTSSKNVKELLRARTPAAVAAVLRKVWQPSDSNPHSIKIGVISGLKDGAIGSFPDRIPKSSVGVLRWEEACLKDRFAAADLLVWYVTSWPVSRKCLKDSVEEILDLCGSESTEIQCGALRAVRNLTEHCKQCSKLIRRSKRLPSFFPFPPYPLSTAYLNDIIRNLSNLTDQRFSTMFTKAVLRRKPGVSRFFRIGVGAQIFMATLCFLAILIMVALILMSISESMGMTINYLDRLSYDLQKLERERQTTNNVESGVYVLSVVSTVVSHTMRLFSGK